MPRGTDSASTIPAGSESIDFDQLLNLTGDDDLGLLASSPESSALLKSIEMDITPSTFLSEVPPPPPPPSTLSQPSVEDVSYIHTLPPELLAPFQQAAPASSQTPLFPHPHPPQFQHVFAPTHFSPRILPSGSNPSLSSLLPCQPSPIASMPADDITMMMPPQDAVSAPPSAAFITSPWAPFWTAAPLPFNPQSYPQVIIPAHTEVPLCPPSSNPRAKIFAQRQKPDTPVDVPAAAERPRTEKKRSATKDPAKNALLNQLAELQKRLISSESQSNALREKLSITQQELAKQKAYLQARQSPMATPPPTPEDFVAQATALAMPPPMMETDSGRPGSPPRANDIYNTASPFKTRTSKQIPAFTEKIDFANIELKKTSSSHVLEAAKTSYLDAQQQWQQRMHPAAQSAIPPASQPITINPRVLHR